MLGAPGLAATATIGQLANLVPASVWLRRRHARAMSLGRSAAGSKSTLLSTTSSRWVAISPTTRHSAVCACAALESCQAELDLPGAFKSSLIQNEQFQTGGVLSQADLERLCNNFYPLPDKTHCAHCTIIVSWRACLDAFGDVDDKEHHVNDLRATDDGADE